MSYMLIIALSPVLALALYIYQKDRYDREPPSLLIKLFIYGCIIVIPVYFVEKFLSAFNIFNSPLYQAFIVAGFTEELFKYIAVRRGAFNSIHYNEKLDGIIYCVFVSLGFAAVENVIYVLFRSNNPLYVGISRGIFAIPAHMLFGVTMGYYLSMAKFAKTRESFFSLQALLMPLILHGIYDYILMSGAYGFFGIFIVFVIILWRINLVRLNRYVRESREGIE